MAHEKNVLLSLRGVKKEFNGFVAVDRMDLDVYEGEFLCFLGPSGCGKTTTLRMIAGLETPTEGDIFFKGRRITYLPPQQRGFGFVFQNYALFWHMTVYDNLAFGLRLRQLPRAEIDKRVREIAERFELVHTLKMEAVRLDLSAMQRVAIARTLLTDPYLLLLDEPLNNIRPGLRELMRADLKRMQRELGRTMIYVTHDQEEAMTLGDRIVVMNQGRVEQIGTPMEIYDHPASLFVASFIGRPPMNLFQADLILENRRVWVSWQGHRWFVNPDRANLEAFGDKSVILGIRPEHVHIKQTGGDIPAVVKLIQPLGRKDIVTLKVGEDIIKAVVPPDHGLSLDDKVMISFPEERIHIFSASTGKAVCHGLC